MEKPSKDVAFAVEKLRSSHRHRAVRAAVFGSGLCKSWPRDPLAAHAELRALWRRCLSRWRNGGWVFSATPAKDALTHQYARNCPPTGVVSPQWERLVPCGRRMLCPYCWGRCYALEAFLAFETVLYGGTDPAAALRVDGDAYELFSCVTSMWWPCDLGSPHGVLRALVQASRRVGRSDRGAGVRRLDGHLGALVFHKVDFAPDRGVVLSRTTLAVAPRGAAAAFGHGAQAAPLTKKALAAAVAAGFAWPSGVLGLPADSVRDLLTTFKGHHMITTYPARAQSRN